MFRKNVEPVASKTGRKRLMFAEDLDPNISSKLSITELVDARKEVKSLSWEDDAAESMDKIFDAVNQGGVIIGDRRLRKSATAVQAYSWACGNSKVGTDDLEILSHMWWIEPTEQPNFVADKIAEIARPRRLRIKNMLSESVQVHSKCNAKDLEQAATAVRRYDIDSL